MTDFIFLSPPHMGDEERASLLEAFDSNWIAPAGPDLASFEHEFAAKVGCANAVALSSGTAALHLALLVLGVGPGDDVLVSDLTFVATANAITYVGARPVFIDADIESWNMDTRLLANELERRARCDELPAAVIVVDLYGQCADYDAIVPMCRRYGVPVIEDAAEAVRRLLEAEHALAGDRSRGVVMLVADDEDDLRRTHAHYFASLEELLRQAVA